MSTLKKETHTPVSQWDEFLYFCIKIQRGVEGREGRMEELTQSGNKTITRGVISRSKRDFSIFECEYLAADPMAK